MTRLFAFLAVILVLACQPQVVPSTATSAPEPTKTPIPMPTPTPRRIQLPTQPIPPATLFARLTHQTGQWKAGRTDFPEGLRQSHALTVGTPQIRVTCIFRRLEGPVPRVNVGFAQNLMHRLVQNQGGEWQGVVESRTSVGGSEVSVEWRTWVTRADRLRLRGEDAYTLIREIRNSSAPSFRLELPNDPHLSRDYDVTGLGEAVSEAGLTCFE